MRKLLSIVLLLALLIGGVEAKHFLRDEPVKAGMSKVVPHGFTLSADASTDHLLWYSSLVRPFFPEFESHFESERKADYIEQLTGSLASPRGPPVLVAGPPIGQRIAAPAPAPAGGGGTTLFLDETGLDSAAFAPSIPRRLTTSYTGSLIRVRRSSDSTEQDIGYNGSNELDTTALATFCSGTDGFVVTIYDQSGNARNITQSTASLQPRIVQSGTIHTGANGKPECRFDGANDYLQTSSFTLNQPTTVFFTFKQIAWATSDSLFDGRSNITMLLYQSPTTPNLRMYAGTDGTAVSFATAASYLATCVFNGASSTFRKNADSENSVSVGTGAPSGITIGARGTFGNPAEIGFQEMVVYPSAKNGTDQTTARNNINAFYALW